ncbi:hypothetical protein B0T16DRAFT_403738 [Cercophora newfieldiana]|uniref:Uncharacterized protein n=1 Tax=Cercophora newfieldiana TaxID=92897 RepID=A0AA39YEV8_9PEZI|nr:hypothetical protein B0T16DRAFT_403738 [Cercophora newfieldiana]
MMQAGSLDRRPARNCNQSQHRMLKYTSVANKEAEHMPTGALDATMRRIWSATWPLAGGAWTHQGKIMSRALLRHPHPATPRREAPDDTRTATTSD